MNVALIGAGWVGVISGACFAELGASVVVIDTDAARIARLAAGELPFWEHDLGPLLKKGLRTGRLAFTTEVSAVASADLVMLAVGTPSRRGSGGPDLQGADVTQVLAAARAVAPHLQLHAVVVTKSTVPVGITREVASVLCAATGRAVPVAANPEFLREGSAVADFLRPHRVLLGVGVNSAREELALRALYAPLAALGTPIVTMSIESAELAKTAANALLALKLAFVNELDALAAAVGADIGQVTHALGLDPRIGPGHLTPGPGFGGSCLPKDTRALAAMFAEHGIDAELPAAALASNVEQKARVVERVVDQIDALGDLRGKTVVALGLSFKAGTDDVRGSPALWLLPTLLERGARVRAHDPHATEAARALLPDAVELAATLTPALFDDADAVVLLTDWEQYRRLNLGAIAARMRTPIAVDLRGAWSVQALAAAGFVNRPREGMHRSFHADLETA